MPRNRLAYRIMLSTAAALATQPSLAQDARTGTSDDILVVGRSDLALKLPTETGSRLGLTPLELPASLSTVDGDTIRARGDLSVVEAVTRAPGITTAANPGNGDTALAARGFAGQGSVLQLVDGIRLFPVAGTITFPVDPWNVDRIEVLNGPASVLYGQGALGAAVNVVTRKPNSERQEFQAEAAYGSQDTVHLAAGAGGPIGKVLAYRIDASYRASDGWVDRGDNRSLALSGALRYAPSDAFSLSLRDDFGDTRPMKYFGAPLIDGRVDDRTEHRNYNVGDARIRFRDNRTSLTAEWKASDTLSFLNTAYRITSKRLFKDLESYCWVAADGFCPNGYNGDAQAPGRIYRTDNLGIIHDQEQIGDQGSLKLSTPLGGSMSNDLVVGFDVNYIKLTYSHDFGSDLQEDTVDPYGFDPGFFFDTQGIAPRYRTRTTEWALFAEDRLKLTDQLSLVAGLRYEKDKVKRRNFVYDANGIITGTVNAFPGGRTARVLDDITGRAGAVYQITPNLSLYAQYSTGVDPVGTLTTYTTSGSQFLFTNAKGDQIEAGVKASFLDGRGSATLAAYRIVKKDLVAQRTPTSAVEQIGQRSSKGVEAALAFALPGGFSLDANGTVLDANYDDYPGFTGNTPNNVPETAANLWLGWQGSGGIRVQGGLRYVGRRFSDDANTFRIPSYTVFDAGLSYAFTPQLAVDVRLTNVTNRDYVTSAYNDQQWILGRPRSIDVALRTQF